jgi:hypothetical protein
MYVVGHAADFQTDAFNATDDASDVAVEFFFDGDRDQWCAVLCAEYDVVKEIRVRSGHWELSLSPLRG